VSLLLLLGGGGVTPTIKVNEPVNYRLNVSVTHPDGSTSRWAGDEPDPANIPQGLRFGTSIPGGFVDATLNLPRRITTDSPDLNLYDTIRVYGAGNQTAWEGRVAGLPRQHDQTFSVQVAAVGWSAHLRDDPSFSMVYADRDLNRWAGPSAARRAAILAVPAGTGDPSTAPDTATGLPTLIQGWRDAWAVRQGHDAWYDSGPGNLIAAIYYDFLPKGGTGTSSPWEWQIRSSSDDILTAAEATANLAAASGSGYYTPATARRYIALTFEHITTGGSAGTNYELHWRKLTAYGDHGLTRRGTAPGGFYASDVIAHVLDTAAPLLNYTTGPGGTITPTTFPIPHLAFHDPTTAEAAISLTNGYHLYEWAVWDNKTFHYTQPNADRLTWQARLGDGAKISLEGDDANNVFNGVFVTYQDPSGIRHTVGPPGSNAEATDATLADTSADNPINAHGIPRRWAKLDISTVTTQAGAIQLGAIWLSEHSLPQRRGVLTLTSTVTHPTKGNRPVFEVRAGDWITIADHPTNVPRRIIETSYDHDQRTLTASLDNTTARIEAVMERMGVALVGVL
jgi:hypothetical protein